MIETVQYKECTCDICGLKEKSSISVIAPKGWWNISFRKEGITYHTPDVCENCYSKITDFIEKMCYPEGDDNGKT